MKNTIPMIVAVLLAAAAVFAVSRLIRPKDADAQAKTVDVVAAAKGIKADAEITQGMLKTRKVAVSDMPAKAVLASQANRILGQKTIRAVSAGDYIVLDDIASRGRTLPELVGEGEWAVPITFADASLVQFLEPGVEIAILGTFTSSKTVAKMDASEKPEIIKEEATSVIFPCVRILDIGHGDGLRRGDIERRGGTIVVSLSPRQAATLIAAQRTMDLYPALRRPGDGSSTKRRDCGMVTMKTFESLRSGLEHISLQDSGN